MSQEAIDFIKRYSYDVVKSVQGAGLFPSVKMAQMIIESSGNDEYGNFHIGRGIAVRKANNYFGIKADSSWKGRAIALSTPKDGKPVSLFRVYDSALESLKDHTRFLQVNTRYLANGVFHSQTPQQQADALQRAGYAESPTYSQALKNMIAAYRLDALDTLNPVNYKNVCLLAGGVVLVCALLYFQDELKQQFNEVINPKPRLRYV